mmetsp:Transcript_55043/g.98041  ORF Transcript_55043/g.98041 Transcript_55043/m.98041 type:complete len:315 (-) Transcript_55043:739-1683(-)
MPIYFGEYDGFNVTIRDPGHAIAAYNDGCFGKGTFSRSQLQHLSLCNVWLQPLQALHNYWRGFRSTRCPSILETEALHLQPEEAFYLLVERRCIKISDPNGVLSRVEAWKRFATQFHPYPTRTFDPNIVDELMTCPRQSFFSRYKVYHHFRSREWIVRHGLEFGVDYLLYDGDPNTAHAAYGVLIIDAPPPTWLDCMRHVRLAETVAKTVLLCQVCLPLYCLEDSGRNEPSSAGSTRGSRRDTSASVPLRLLTDATAQHLVPIACVRQVEVARHRGFLRDDRGRSRDRGQGGDEMRFGERARADGQDRNKRQKV